MYRIQCSTFFDITASGVQRNRWNPSTKIFSNDGHCIDTEEKFQISRQQQSNWNTVQQILMLRCLPENIEKPVKKGDQWIFCFDVPDINAVAWGMDPVGALRYDANGVPMITGLTEDKSLPEYLVPYGEDRNIWFDVSVAK